MVMRVFSNSHTVTVYDRTLEEIFKFSDCRHGTRNLVESSAGKTKGPDRKVWTLIVSLSAFQNVWMHPWLPVLFLVGKWVLCFCSHRCCNCLVSQNHTCPWFGQCTDWKLSDRTFPECMPLSRNRWQWMMLCRANPPHSHQTWCARGHLSDLKGLLSRRGWGLQKVYFRTSIFAFLLKILLWLDSLNFHQLRNQYSNTDRALCHLYQQSTLLFPLEKKSWDNKSIRKQNPSVSSPYCSYNTRVQQ